jgi:hypothetical protein
MKLFLKPLFFLLLFPVFLNAQQFSESQLKIWKESPEWIAMMDQPDANYFAVVAAFDAFWSEHELPVEEDQVLGASREKKEEGSFIKRLFRGKEKKERAMRHRYAFQVKKYRHWVITVEPYVQDDGSIMSKEKQLELWKNQRAR